MCRSESFISHMRNIWQHHWNKFWWHWQRKYKIWSSFAYLDDKKKIFFLGQTMEKHDLMYFNMLRFWLSLCFTISQQSLVAMAMLFVQIFMKISALKTSSQQKTMTTKPALWMLCKRHWRLKFVWWLSHVYDCLGVFINFVTPKIELISGLFKGANF